MRTNDRHIDPGVPTPSDPAIETQSRRSRLVSWTIVAWAAVVMITAALVLRVDDDRAADVDSAAARPLAGDLFVDPASQAAIWVEAHEDEPLARTVGNRIASQPTAKWFGAWSGDITQAVSEYVSLADQEGKIPTLVAYNVPGRDCGGHSSGGLTSAGQYAEWIDGFAAGIDDRRAIVVLEPDALAQLESCLSASQQGQRLRMLADAVQALQSRNVRVYLDAGHSNWVPAGEMAHRLRQAGVGRAHGFALNVSNYQATADEEAYAADLNTALGASKPFLIDTSRNGNGSQDGQWCNPAGTKLGEAPRMVGDDEMLLWIKAPGESDGTCGMAPDTLAGQFAPSLAKRLVTGE